MTVFSGPDRRIIGSNATIHETTWTANSKYALILGEKNTHMEFLGICRFSVIKNGHHLKITSYVPWTLLYISYVTQSTHKAL